MPQPDLLILDEPFDGLDVAARAQLAEMLSTLSPKASPWYWSSTALMISLILCSTLAYWLIAT